MKRRSARDCERSGSNEAVLGGLVGPGLAVGLARIYTSEADSDSAPPCRHQRYSYKERTALRGAAAYQLSWMDAHLWAYAETYGLSELLSEDFQHDRLYGTVRAVNPFL